MASKPAPGDEPPLGSRATLDPVPPDRPGRRSRRQLVLRALLVRLRIVSSPYGSMGRTWLTSSSVAWAAVLLTVFLVLYFLRPPGG